MEKHDRPGPEETRHIKDQGYSSDGFLKYIVVKTEVLSFNKNKII